MSLKEAEKRQDAQGGLPVCLSGLRLCELCMHRWASRSSCLWMNTSFIQSVESSARLVPLHLGKKCFTETNHGRVAHLALISM